MPSFVKDTFRSVFVEQLALTLLSRREGAVTRLFTQLAQTELSLYFVSPGVEALRDIVFSESEVTEFVYALSAGFRLEMAVDDEPFKIINVYQSIAESLHDDAARSSPIKNRLPPEDFYEAKQSTLEIRKNLLITYEWLFVCLMLRANLATYSAILSDQSKLADSTPSK